ncbi:MAG: type II secretion system protein, partial [Candidatus Microthrix parvicella]|nr:type II secretion system protein [Candidatus Microthrix parvicella]
MTRVARQRRASGFTLIESLVSVMITSMVVVGLMGGVMTALKSSALQRRAATSEVVISNFSESFADVPYVACATIQDYNDAIDAVATPDGFRVAVTDVSFWDEGSTNPATFKGQDECTSAEADTGLQKIEYSVTTDADDGPEVRKHSILKRFDGTLSDLYEQVPAGAVRCNVTADRDTFLDEADADANHGGEVSMDVAGIAGSERQGLVHFDLDPANAKCDNGDGIPVGMSVRSVEMRLYTWQVTGSPDCASACKHALRRVTGNWAEDTVTWGSRPAVDPGGAIPFKHGTGSGDLSPRHQIITDANLLNQVSLYYQAPPENNRGWLIEQDCGASKADCEAPAPGFRMRTREWPNV